MWGLQLTTCFIEGEVELLIMEFIIVFVHSKHVIFKVLRTAMGLFDNNFLLNQGEY